MRGIEYTTKRLAVLLAGVALVVLLAGTAHARYFSVTTVGSKLTLQTGDTVLPFLGEFTGYTSAQWRPVTGTPMYVTATGSSPATLTLRPGLFDQPGNQFILPIGPSLPGYVQLTTSLGVYAPKTSSAVFKPGSKTSRPANFDWCPGATANPGCTTASTGGSQGTRRGIIKYTAGTAQFGGTMNIFYFGAYEFWTVEQVAPTRHVAHRGNGSIALIAAAGPGYEFAVVNTAGPGDPIYASPVYSPTYGLLTDPGMQLPSPYSTIPGETTTSVGFPFTTGMVYIKIPANPPAVPQAITISKTGTDSRTPLGLGNITMVAGALALGTTGISTPNIVTLTLNVPEPSRFLMLASGVGLLGLLVRGRRALARRGAQAA